MAGDITNRLSEVFSEANRTKCESTEAWVEQQLIPALDKEGLAVVDRGQVQTITRHDFFTAAAMISMGGIDADGNEDTMDSDVEYCKTMADKMIKR